MDRPSYLRYGRILGSILLLAVLAAAGGCTSALATAVWLIKGPNVPAEFAGMREKKVVVVCRPVTSSLYAHPGVAKDVSRKIGRLLAANGRKVTVVDQRKVDEWMDTNTWDDFTEVGKALEADLVLGIDLEEFSIYESQTLFQGKATCGIQVYDCESGDLVFERYPPQTIYPPNHVVPTSSMQESDFRREFVNVLADQIGRHFYAHDPRDYWAMDSSVIH